MKITPRRIVKAVTPYGIIVAYRRFRSHTSLSNIASAERSERNKKFSKLLSGAKYLKKSKTPKIIISLTSYGYRISDTAPIAVASLFNQTVLPDKIILWLAHNDRPSSKLKKLMKYGLEIKYTEDTGSYKKLIPALKQYPNSTIITVDDDVVYPEDWLAKNIKVHKKNQNTILASRGRKISIIDNNLLSYNEWPLLEKNIENSHLILPNGIGGILYPPRSLDKRVFNKEKFTQLAPNGDDLWFWAMAELKGTKRMFIENGFRDTHLYELDKAGLWNTTNSGGGNDMQFTNIIKEFPALKKAIGIERLKDDFPGSAAYWENRYADGGNSGAGSYDNLSEFKAEIINKFVEKNKINSVMEFGTGDGAQLLLANYPHYIGFDVSKTAIEMCNKMFNGDKTKKFYTLDKYKNQKADVTMSLDVLYHLVEQDIFEEHIKTLFKTAKKFVIVYAADGDDFHTADHVKSRSFTDYIEKNIRNWELYKHIPNEYPYDENNPQHTTWADFYIYKRVKR